jgi:hypothetical protein
MKCQGFQTSKIFLYTYIDLSCFGRQQVEQTIKQFIRTTGMTKSGAIYKHLETLGFAQFYNKNQLKMFKKNHHAIVEGEKAAFDISSALVR